MGAMQTRNPNNERSCHHLHRRRLFRQSRPRRLGRPAGERRARKRAVRRRARHHQQPDGAQGGHRGVALFTGSLPDRSAHRFQLPAPGDHRVAAGLEAQRVADRQRPSGEKPRFMDGTRTAGPSSSGHLALGQGARGSSRQRAGRSLGQPGFTPWLPPPEPGFAHPFCKGLSSRGSNPRAVARRRCVV